MSRVRLNSAEYNLLGESLQDIIDKKLELKRRHNEYAIKSQIEWQRSLIRKFEYNINKQLFIKHILLPYIDKYIIQKNKKGAMLFFNKEYIIYNNKLPRLEINFLIDCFKFVIENHYNKLRFNTIHNLKKNPTYSFKVFVELNYDNSI